MELSTSIFSKWGIDIPEDTDYIEYLQNHYPHNVYFIDQTPFSSDEKHLQIELLFQEVLEGKVQKSKFEIYENKFTNILSILWLYNDVLSSSNIYNVKIKGKHKKIEKILLRNYSQLKKNFKTSSILKINNLKDLELLVQLGLRNLVFTEFYFSGYEVLVVPSWSCFIIYCHNLENIKNIEKIVNVQGLFLRPCKE